MTKTWTPPTAVDSRNKFAAPVLEAGDTQASVITKLLQANQDPNASEATSVSDLGQELRQQVAFLEADESLSPTGRRDRLVPEVERVKGRLAKVRATISSLDEHAERLEGHAQDFEDGEEEGDRLFVRTQLATRAASSPAERAAIGRQVLAAAAKPFDQLTRAEGNLLKAAFDAADLGAPIVDEVVMDAAWKMRRGGDVNNPEVAALRARADTLRGVVGAVEQSLGKLSKAYGIE